MAIDPYIITENGYELLSVVRARVNADAKNLKLKRKMETTMNTENKKPEKIEVRVKSNKVPPPRVEFSLEAYDDQNFVSLLINGSVAIDFMYDAVLDKVVMVRHDLPQSLCSLVHTNEHGQLVPFSKMHFRRR